MHARAVEEDEEASVGCFHLQPLSAPPAPNISLAMIYWSSRQPRDSSKPAPRPLAPALGTAGTCPGPCGGGGQGRLGVCKGSAGVRAAGGSRGSHKAVDVSQSPVPGPAGSNVLLQPQEHPSGVTALSPVGIHPQPSSGRRAHPARLKEAFPPQKRDLPSRSWNVPFPLGWDAPVPAAGTSLLGGWGWCQLSARRASSQPSSVPVSCPPPKLARAPGLGLRG